MNNKKIIFTPGPQKSIGVIKKDETLFHRSHEMKIMIAELNKKICDYFKTKYAHVFPLSGTDTIDLFIRSVNQKESASVINTGYWAQSIANVLQGNNISVKIYEREVFGMNEDELFQIFSKDDAKVFYAIASETSSGEYFNYQKIYKTLKKLNKYLFMDAISLPVYNFLDNKKYNFDADFTIYSSSKTFHGTPGFNFILTDLDINELPIFTNKCYFSLKLYSQFAAKNEFPETINTVLFMDFKNSFEYTVNNTQEIRDKIAELREYLVLKIPDKEIIFLNQGHRDVTNLVVLQFPKWMDACEFTDLLDKKQIYIGRDLLQKNTVRICLNSYNTIEEIDLLIEEVKKFIKKYKK